MAFRHRPSRGATFALAMIMAAAGCTKATIRTQGRGKMREPVIARSASPSPAADLDITPAGISAARPDVVKIGDSFYVHVLKFSGNRQCFNLIKLSKDLKTVYSEDIYSGNGFPTDARVSVDDKGMLWYPFETVRPQDQAHYLNLARYDVSGNPSRPTLLKSALEIATPSQFADPPPGVELMDDPSPISRNARYYVATRAASPPWMYLRSFSRDLAPLESRRTLDFESSVGRMSVSPGSLVDIDGGMVLVVGVFNGGERENGLSKIMAVPLNESFAPRGSAVSLTDEKQYSTYVSSVRYRQGKLYVLYNIMTVEQASGTPGEGHRGMLGVYDARSGFKLLKSVEINSGIMPDNHTSMEFSENALLVFYPTPSRKIMVKRLELSSLGNGGSAGHR
jgi:hypothetical protein